MFDKLSFISRNALSNWAVSSTPSTSKLLVKSPEATVRAMPRARVSGTVTDRLMTAPTPSNRIASSRDAAPISAARCSTRVSTVSI